MTIALVSFTDLDRTPIQVNPALVASLSPVPPDLLNGNPAGTYIDLSGGAAPVRVGVVGALAAVAAALVAASGIGSRLTIVVKGSDGSTLGASPAALAAGMVATRNGVGDYTITVNPPGFNLPTDATPFLNVTDIDATACLGNGGPITPTTTPVLTFAGGVAADVNFVFSILVSP